MDHAIPRRQAGATLTEALVGLGIAAGALGMAAPTLQGAVDSVRLSSAANAVLADLYLARSEALRRNRRVALCKSPDGLLCSQQGGWEQGWILFEDANNNGTIDPGEPLINRHPGLESNLLLRGNQPVSSYISYSPEGASKLTGGGFQAGTLTICRQSAAPTPSRQMVLNAIGRPRIQKATQDFCG